MLLMLDFTRYMNIVGQGGMMTRYIIMVMTASLLAATGTFRFAVIGDRTGGYVGEVFEEIIEEVRLFDPDFVICVGDLIEGYTDDTLVLHAQWDTIAENISRLPRAFYYVAGNHDIQNDRDRFIYETRTGQHRYYSFDHLNSHFIVLDNTMTYWASPQEMDDEQIEWLRADLEKHDDKENIFVFYHIPTYLYAVENDTTDMLAELFELFDVTTVFTGHHHTYAHTIGNGVEYVNVGSSGGGMSTAEFVRGHFYHWLFVTVRGEAHEIAVVEHGNVHARDIVTVDALRLIARADEAAVTMEPIITRDGATSLRLKHAVSIDNFGPDSLIDTLVWEYDTTRYMIDPVTCPVALAPGEKRSYPIQVTVHNGSHIFPIPRSFLAFPFSHGKVCSVRSYLPVTRSAGVKRTLEPPVLDGRLDEEIWKRVMPIQVLGTYDGLPDPPVEKTEMYFVHDDNNLYIGARCHESDLSRIKADATQPDAGSPYDDNLWMFFDTDHDQTTYYQAIINANGVVFDRRCQYTDEQSERDITWNGPWEIITGREEHAWVLEIKRSKDALAPYDEDIWGFNFRRLQPRTGYGDAGYWSIPFGHLPAYFGILEFE
jgi:predicted phosphodiesterase